MLALKIHELPVLNTSHIYGLSTCYLSQILYTFWMFSSNNQKYIAVDIFHTHRINYIDLLLPPISSIYNKPYQILNTLTDHLGNKIVELHYNRPRQQKESSSVLKMEHFRLEDQYCYEGGECTIIK